MENSDVQEWLSKLENKNVREWLLKTENKDVLEWLREFKTRNTIKLFSWMIKRFFEWYARNHEDKNALDFALLDAKTMAHEVLLYQSHLQSQETKDNTIRAAITPIKSYCEYLDKPLNLRRKVVKIEMDTSSHVFRNGDLSAMFNVSGTKEKAILSVMASLGWEREGVLELEREFIEKQLAIAKNEDKQFIFFDAKRGKTKALRLGILNPLAVEWLRKWLETEESKKSDKLFDMTSDGLNKLIKRLARDARILTSGRVHSHLIRGWTMSQLSRAGFVEWEVKFAVGKSIPASDATYLRRLKDAIEEKYPKVYDAFLNINPPIIKETVKPERVESLEQQIQQLIKENMKLREDFTQAEEKRSKAQIQDVVLKNPELIDALYKRIQQSKQTQT